MWKRKGCPDISDLRFRSFSLLLINYLIIATC